MEIWQQVATLVGPLVALVGLWLGVVWLLSGLSGWRGLAARFPDRVIARGERIQTVSARMGVVNFNHVLVLDLDEVGIRFSTWMPAIGAFRPFHVQWSDFAALAVRQGIFRRRLDLEMRNGARTITLYGAAVDRVLAASERRTSGRRGAGPPPQELSSGPPFLLIGVALAFVLLAAGVMFFQRFADPPGASAAATTPVPAVAPGSAPAAAPPAHAATEPADASETAPAWPAWSHERGSAFAVDAPGARIAIASGGGWLPPTITTHAWRDGGWHADASTASLPVRSLHFEGDALETNLGARADEVESNTPLRQALSAGDVSARCGDLIVVGGAGTAALASVLRRGTDGWMDEGALTFPTAEPIHAQHRAFACDGERILVFVAPFAERCAVVEFVRQDATWTPGEPWFPALCPEPGNVGGVSLAYDGQRLLAGAFPLMGDAPGAATLYARDGDHWQEHASLAPWEPGQNSTSDAAAAGTRSDFGAQVALGGERAFVVAGRKQIFESRPGRESSSHGLDSVFVFVRAGSKWVPEQHLEHAMGADFGRTLVVRDTRLFIGAPVEPAVYAFERRGSEWTAIGRVTGDPTPAQAPSP